MRALLWWLWLWIRPSVRRRENQAQLSDMRRGWARAREAAERASPLRRCARCLAYWPRNYGRCPSDGTDLAGPDLCRGSGEPGELVEGGERRCAWCAFGWDPDAGLESIPPHTEVRPPLPPPPEDDGDQDEEEEERVRYPREATRAQLREAVEDVRFVAELVRSVNPGQAARLEALAKGVEVESLRLLETAGGSHERHAGQEARTAVASPRLWTSVSPAGRVRRPRPE